MPTPLATRLIFVEGIVGAGKSTTAAFIERQLLRNGITAHYVFEGGIGHPTRLMGELAHPFAPWLDLDVAGFRNRAREKWQMAAQLIQAAGTVAVFDGQLFHGNLADLLMMDAGPDDLRGYVEDTLAITAPLHPTLVYLRPADLEGAVRRVIAERGPKWEQYQIEWKLASPYARRRDLSGVDGLLELLRAHRAVSDDLLAFLGIPALVLDTDADDWPACRRQILGFLGLPPADDTNLSWHPTRRLPGTNHRMRPHAPKPGPVAQ